MADGLFGALYRRAQQAAMEHQYNNVLARLRGSITPPYIADGQRYNYDIDRDVWTTSYTPKKQGKMLVRMELQHEINGWLEDSL